MRVLGKTGLFGADRRGLGRALAVRGVRGEAVKGGKASRDELVALGKQVFDEVKASIAPEAQRVITKNLGSFDEYLTKCIEAAVLEIKQNEPYITLPESALIEGEAER